MKKFEIFPYICTACVAIVFAYSSCNKEEDKDSDSDASTSSLTVHTAKDIVAGTEKLNPRGAPTYLPPHGFYSLSEHKVISHNDSATTKWDIAFLGSNIITNGGSSGPGKGGAILQDGIFDKITEAPESGYKTDSSGAFAIPPALSPNSWGKYTGTESPMHAILPVAGKVIILRTAQGKYAKIQILSLYKGNPDPSSSEFADPDNRPPAGHYHFKYVYQADGSTRFK